MKIVILTIGTLGDVVPYAALGAGLTNAGYDVYAGNPQMLYRVSRFTWTPL